MSSYLHILHQQILGHVIFFAAFLLLLLFAVRIKNKSVTWIALCLVVGDVYGFVGTYLGYIGTNFYGQTIPSWYHFTNVIFIVAVFLTFILISYFTILRSTRVQFRFIFSVLSGISLGILWIAIAILALGFPFGYVG
jgi:hypothetical protein